MKTSKPKAASLRKNPFGIKTWVYHGLWGLAVLMLVGITAAQFTVTSSGGSGVYSTNSLGTLYFYSGSTTGYLFPNGSSLEEYYFWTRRPTAASSFSATRCSSYNREYNTFGTTGFTIGDDCRDNHLGSYEYYCSGGNRWRRRRWEGVCNTASGYCSDSNSYQGGYSSNALYQTCTYGCSSGTCNTGCTHGQTACNTGGGVYGNCSWPYCEFLCSSGVWTLEAAGCDAGCNSGCILY